MTINIISPHLGSLMQYRSHQKKIRKLEKGLTEDKETDDQIKIWCEKKNCFNNSLSQIFCSLRLFLFIHFHFRYTQEELNAVYLGPPFRLNHRYTQLLVNFFICWMYAISMPILPLIGAISFYVSYWVDKFLFCNFYRIPPKYSDKIGRKSTNLIAYGIFLHIFMSCWILGNHQIFSGKSAFDYEQHILKQNVHFKYIITNENIVIRTQGTGKVVLNYALQLDRIGTSGETPPSAFPYTPSTPAYVNGSTLIYSGSAGVGSTGLYFVNDTLDAASNPGTGELISKNKALVFSMLF